MCISHKAIKYNIIRLCTLHVNYLVPPRGPASDPLAHRLRVRPRGDCTRPHQDRWRRHHGNKLKDADASAQGRRHDSQIQTFGQLLSHLYLKAYLGAVVYMNKFGYKSAYESAYDSMRIRFCVRNK
jgi:hypothetical protein